MPNYHRPFPGGARKLFNIFGSSYCDENAKVEVAAAASQLNRAESEVKALRAMTQNDINSEKMEEVVLKKCWLARYWGLVAKYGQKVKEKCWKKSLLRHRLAASSSSVLFITVTAVRFCCCRILPLLLPPLLLPYSFWRWCSGDVTCPCYNLQG
ncbi:uncharacterized protein [Arachis hypogaea]|uniref:uncharacterized protein isoform X4 n=1 Tax=Arachis hypogaea TaxID=3818 RepID=UPI000DEC82F6|nr:uncharacterized protein LOC112750331 isoform X4 [Arachis hypogaea]